MTPMLAVGGEWACETKWDFRVHGFSLLGEPTLIRDRPYVVHLVTLRGRSFRVTLATDRRQTGTHGKECQ